MEFHVILTLYRPATDEAQGEGRYATVTATVTANPGNTRNGVLGWAFKQAPQGFEGADVLFFSAEPNILSAATGTALVILTLALPTGPGRVELHTICKPVPAPPGSTRSGLYSWALKQAPPKFQTGANVLFFDAKPNTLLSRGEQ